MHNMLDKVLGTVKEYNMLNEGERVLVGLSGGADSVALSLCLKKLGADVACVHINHCLRGSESDADEAFCKAFCKRMGFELRCFRVDVNEYCREHKVSCELGARTLRYECFDKALKELECIKLATAHTLSDCFETALINLVRGCGVRGVSGIPPVRDNIIRPLIECSRQEIEEFLSELGESYVTDSTNLVADCTRNIIRLNVVPELLKINSGLFTSYLSTSRNLRATDSYLGNICDSSIKRAKISDTEFDTAVLLSLDELIAGMTVSEILKINCGESSAEYIGEVLRICSQGGQITLRGGVLASVKNGVLRFSPPDKKTEEWSQKIVIGEKLSVFGKMLCVNFSQADNIHKKFTKHQLDYDKIKGTVFVRNRRNGDKIKLAGRGVTSAVKTLFNSDVPVSERMTRLFVCDDEGIVYLEGYGCAERVRCDENTKNVIEISIIKL